MEPPLWTDRYAPRLTQLPQPALRERLNGAIDEPINLILQGPPGAGKTAAVRALAEAAHDKPDADLIEINVADFFNRTKKQIRNDPRFERFLQGQTEFSKQYRRGEKTNKYKRQWSKRDMISHVMQELAAYQPATGEYKTVLLDNAEQIREDFQQSLRRVMEQYYRNTQFVIATRQPTKLIPTIRSRCFPIPVRALTTDEILEVLQTIIDAENRDIEPIALDLIASKADGNLRYALLALQEAAVEASDTITPDDAQAALSATGHTEIMKSVLDDAAAGNIEQARNSVTELLDDSGFGGQELLRELLTVANQHFETYGNQNIVRLHCLAGTVDRHLAEGSSARVHLTHLLSAWSTGRESLTASQLSVS